MLALLRISRDADSDVSRIHHTPGRLWSYGRHHLFCKGFLADSGHVDHHDHCYIRHGGGSRGIEPSGPAAASALLAFFPAKWDAAVTAEKTRSSLLTVSVARSRSGVKFGAAATILAIVVSLKLLVGCFKDIAKLDVGKALGSRWASTTIVVERIRIAPDISRSIDLSLLDPQRLLGATAAISTLVAVFSLLVASTHFAKKA